MWCIQKPHLRVSVEATKIACVRLFFELSVFLVEEPSRIKERLLSETEAAVLEQPSGRWDKAVVFYPKAFLK